MAQLIFWPNSALIYFDIKSHALTLITLGLAELQQRKILVWSKECFPNVL